MSEKSLEPSKDAWEEVGQVLDAECNSVDDIRTDLEKTDKGNVKQSIKNCIWRYFMSYWNNRRICSSNEGLPPLIKRRMYYGSEMGMVA